MVFSIPSYLGVGDRYKKPIDARAQGATFLVSRPKTGTNPDALFDKEFHYMWNGERGGDAETVRMREMHENNKKNLTPNGFVYTGPPVFTHFRIEQPWRPAGYVEDKPTTMEYWEDPYRGYDPRKEPKEYVKKPSSSVFLPSSRNDGFWYTQSVVFKRI